MPKSEGDWLKLLEQQEQLHETELNRWQDILASSIQLMDHMKLTLGELKSSLDHRRGGGSSTGGLYTRQAQQDATASTGEWHDP